MGTKSKIGHLLRQSILIAIVIQLTCSLDSPGQSDASSNLIEPVLKLEKVGTTEKSFHVVSTLIVGPTESIVVDGLYKVSDGKRLANRIAATGTKLKAMILSHADHDHYMGAMEVLKRFPGTPVYLTQSGLDDFNKRSQPDFEAEKKRNDPEVPEKIVQPKLLTSESLHVDGYEIVVIPDLVGDVRAPSSAAFWIPSLRTVLAGDLVFEGIHPWLGDSDKASRVEWRKSLIKLSELNPEAVIPGHKRDITSLDSPAQIQFMIKYLEDYDSAMDGASTSDEVVEAMLLKYKDLSLSFLMAYGAKTWFKK